MDAGWLVAGCWACVKTEEKEQINETSLSRSTRLLKAQYSS
jgi:hypothetical protein